MNWYLTMVLAIHVSSLVRCLAKTFVQIFSVLSFNSRSADSFLIYLCCCCSAKSLFSLSLSFLMLTDLSFFLFGCAGSWLLEGGFL